MKTYRVEVLAWQLGWDVAEVRDYRYQPTRNWSTPLWAFDDCYYTVTLRSSEKPPEGYEWEDVTSDFVRSKFPNARVLCSGTQIQ